MKTIQLGSTGLPVSVLALGCLPMGTTVSESLSFQLLDRYVDRERSKAGAQPKAGGGEVLIALLRGVNVGGKNVLPMKALAEIFAGAGCSDVRTFIQSGNVLFRASPTVARRVSAAVPQAIEARFGFRSPVVVRTAGELLAVARGNPFLRSAADPKQLHVAFLLDQPGKKEITALDPEHSPPDRFAVRGREIYLCLPNGMAKTRLTAQYFDSRLGTTCTARNWNTVLKLVELSRAEDPA